MKKYMDLIRKSKLFYGMSCEDIEAMLECLDAHGRKFSNGEYIYRIGDVPEKAAMILDGSVYVDREDHWGNKSIIAEISRGGLIGEVYSLIDGGPMTINAVAAGDVYVLFMNMKKVFSACTNLCPHHARLMKNLVSVMAFRNYELTRKIEHISQRTTRSKLLSYLSEQALIKNNSEFDISFNRQQLADFLSVERSAMSKELGKLKNEGIIEFDKNHFKLNGGISENE